MSTDPSAPSITYSDNRVGCQCGATATVPANGPELGEAMRRWVTEHAGCPPLVQYATTLSSGYGVDDSTPDAVEHQIEGAETTGAML